MQQKFTVSQRTAPHRREGRGEQSSLAFKGAWIKTAYWNRADFDQVKRVLFYTTIEKF